MTGVTSNPMYGRPLTGDALRRAAAKLRKSYVAKKRNQVLNAGGPPLINPATGLPFPGIMIFPTGVNENLVENQSTAVVRPEPASWGAGDPRGMGGTIIVEVTDEGGACDRRIIAIQKPIYIASGQWSSTAIKTLSVANPEAPIYSIWQEVTPVGGIPTELPSPLWEYPGLPFTTEYLVPQGADRVQALGPVVLTWTNWADYDPGEARPAGYSQTLAAGDIIPVPAGSFRVDRDVNLQFLLRPL